MGYGPAREGQSAAGRPRGRRRGPGEPGGGWLLGAWRRRGKGREGRKPAAGAAGKGGGSEGEERDRWQRPDAARRGAFPGGAGPLRAGDRRSPGAPNSGDCAGPRGGKQQGGRPAR